jgi:tungstate transport system substrate-binding protein
VGLVATAAGLAAAAAAESIVVASTTSTENSGLFDAILPEFLEKTGIEVRPVAVGTGQAIRMARLGDVDVLLVHDRASEEAFVAEGFGVERHQLMYNDFVVVGPAADPAGISGLGRVAEALRRIASARAPFVSRGDDSGTHKAELRLWREAGLDPGPASGTWYREAGQGQGATLGVAAGMDAYMFVDRGTWISFANRSDLKLLVEGDPLLLNQYGVTLVNPKRHPHVKAEAGQAFIDWLVSGEGQRAIGAFRLHGQLLFTPNAKPSVK